MTHQNPDLLTAIEQELTTVIKNIFDVTVNHQTTFNLAQAIYYQITTKPSGFEPTIGNLITNGFSIIGYKLSTGTIVWEFGNNQ